MFILAFRNISYIRKPNLINKSANKKTRVYVPYVMGLNNESRNDLMWSDRNGVLDKDIVLMIACTTEATLDDIEKICDNSFSVYRNVTLDNANDKVPYWIPTKWYSLLILKELTYLVKIIFKALIIFYNNI